MAEKRTENLVELSIDGVTSEGRGVGRLDGLAVFTAGALPGERVLSRIVARKKNFALAETERVLSAAPGRVNPSCPDYDCCGGCSLQHADYLTELELKRRILQQSLRRLGGQEIDIPLPLASARPAFYRNRAVLHYEDGRLGFYNEDSHSVTPRESCELLIPALNEFLGSLQSILSTCGLLPDLRAVGLRCDACGERLLLTFICGRSIKKLADIAQALSDADDRLVSVWENSGPPVYGVYGANWTLIQGQNKLRDSIGPVKLDLSPGSFLQVNPAQTLVLYDLVRRYVSLSGSENVLDLYSGVGSIALYLAPFAGRVRGVERYAPAVADATANAALNGADNCRFYCAKAEDILPRWAAAGCAFDVAVLDPPRAGCDKRLLDAVAGIAPPRIIYVSCNPATLARDLKILTGQGYFIESLQPVDMFPRTHHVETVVLMSRVKD